MGIYRREVYRSPTLVVDFEMDRIGIAKVAVGPELHAAVLTIAGKGLLFAESISPVSTREHRHYAQSFSVHIDHIVLRGLRHVVARLVISSGHAAAVEWGTRTHPDGHHVLRRTLQHIGHGVPTGFLGMPSVRRVALAHIPAGPAAFRASTGFLPAGGGRRRPGGG